MPERPITFEESINIGRWLSNRRQKEGEIKFLGHGGYVEGTAQIVRIDGEVEPIILTSKYDPEQKVRQNYLVTSEMGFEILEVEGFIKPEIDQELARTVAGTD